MAQLTHTEYDALERAVMDRRRIVIFRRGTEYVVVPQALRMREGRELIEATHPTTGEAISFYLDEVDSIQPVA
jgi:hypothetical protein